MRLLWGHTRVYSSLGIPRDWPRDFGARWQKRGIPQEICSDPFAFGNPWGAALTFPGQILRRPLVFASPLSNPVSDRQCAPAPKTWGWLARICSMSVLPERGRPTTKTAPGCFRPSSPASARTTVGSASAIGNACRRLCTILPSSCPPNAQNAVFLYRSIVSRITP